MRPSTGRVDRRRVENVLPPGVLADLRAATAGADEMTAELAAELDDRFEVAKRYGVTRRRLRNYLTRVRQNEPEPILADSGEPERASAESDSWRRKVSAHRRRQASVAEILDKTFGRFAESKPELWERRAYLMLVGQVYERLAISQDELSTDEVIKLAKALAENRRVEARVRDGAESGSEVDNHSAVPGALPESLAESVRQIYGTTLPTAVRDAKGDAE